MGKGLRHFSKEDTANSHERELSVTVRENTNQNYSENYLIPIRTATVKKKIIISE